MANPKDRKVQDLAPPLARHEFGHYITARVLGFTVDDVSLTIWHTGHHNATSVILPATSLKNVDEIKTYLENRIIVLYAGSLAQSLSKGKVKNDVALELLGQIGDTSVESTAAHDYSKARELVHTLRSIAYVLPNSKDEILKQYDEISDRVWLKAIQLVEEESALIEGMGKILASRVTKNGQTARISKTEIDASELMKARFS